MAEVSTVSSNTIVKRTDFLTGLCLFSIIGSCWFLLCSIVQFFKADEQTEAVAKEVRDILATDEFQRSVAYGIAPKMGMQMAERMVQAFTIENLQIISAAGFISAWLCLIGVYLMWNLKKKGYYFYLAGIFVGVLTLIILFGFTRVFTMGMLALNGIITLFKLLGANSSLAAFSTVVTIVIWSFFILMYRKELKHMN